MYARMPWGKYKGWPLSEVPGSYLCWCLEECDLRPSLEDMIRRELGERFADRAPPRYSPPPRRGGITSDLLGAWYRRLCLDFHPDRGGSTEAMQALNEAHERLMKLVEASS